MYLIIFQLQKNDQLIKLKINRYLKRIRANMIIKGVWRHENASLLINLASWIKNRGGKAYVIEENIIY